MLIRSSDSNRFDVAMTLYCPNLNLAYLFVGFACVPLEIEVDGSPDIPEESFATAVQFGVDIDGASDRINAQKYVAAFFQKLLLQREKLEQNLLVQHLKPKIAKMWQQVLSHLEEHNRRVTNVEQGSIIFQLLCPTLNSIEQLAENGWRAAVEEDMEKLCKELGINFIDPVF